ncbi:hypothetical protein [Tessaracoccus sp.]
MSFSHSRARTSLGVAVALFLAVFGILPVHSAPPQDAAPIVRPLTNLSHLNLLGDTVAPPTQEGHSTYRQEEDPGLGVLWTYADRRDGGIYEPVGGGPYDEVTNTWGQGAFNTDDLTRAAVVYLRHWRGSDDDDSRERAFQLLRTVAYMQTTTGDDAGNVVLWMQPDGTLNPSPEPVELPNPSDAEESYWLARTIWALGEGFEAFEEEDPAFAAFLEGRLDLALAALERSSLSRYGEWDVADGTRVPAWLITDAADATAEAVLGLSAYVRSAPSGTRIADRADLALERYAEGIAAMSAGDAGNWPFGAVVQWTHSRSLWHAWASQMPAALAQASDALEAPDPALLGAALTDVATFTPYLLTSTGPVNGWQPSPTDLTQIAYGVDSRLQSLLTVSDVTERPGLRSLAAMTAAWYFGANRAGAQMYDPATGVTFDGLNADGEVNRNSGAESSIHGLLSMLALDAHPGVATEAQTLTTLGTQDGVVVAEGEKGTVQGSAMVVTPESSWTGESAWSGGAYLDMPSGSVSTWTVPASTQPRLVLPVLDLVTTESAVVEFSTATTTLGRVDAGAGGEQGVTESPGSLVPVTLDGLLPDGSTELQAVATGGGASAKLDAVLLIPAVSRLVLTGGGSQSVLLHNSTQEKRTGSIAGDGNQIFAWSSYDNTGALVEAGTGRDVPLQPQGFAIVGNPAAPPTTPTPTVDPGQQPTPTPSAVRPGLPSTGN